MSPRPFRRDWRPTVSSIGLILTPGRSHESAAQEIEGLKRELYTRNRQLNEAEEELRKERQKTAAMEKGVATLRVQLRPLHQALLMVFGEIDSMDVGVDAKPKNSAI